MADRMTTSNDRTLPQGLTEAEAVAQEQKGFTETQRQRAEQAAVTREEAEKRLKADQQSAYQAKQQKAHEVVVEQPVHMKQHPALGEIKGHLDAMAVLCLGMKSGPELSAFYMHLGNCQRQMENLEVADEDVV